MEEDETRVQEPVGEMEDAMLEKTRGPVARGEGLVLCQKLELCRKLGG